MRRTRWEDDRTLWRGPFYGADALRYARAVSAAPIAGRLITCVEVVDWTGTGGRDVLLSSWDACYDGGVFLYRQIGTHPDGTPILGEEERIEDVHGFVTAVADGDIFHLVSASRLRRQLYLFLNIGQKGQPKFDAPQILELEADWIKGNEYIHLARFYDIDGDGMAELIVGTDYWDDYWPNGLEWNDEGYRAYDDAGRWLGGPLRGYIYVFKNRGTLAAPKLEKGTALRVADMPREQFSQVEKQLWDNNCGKNKQPTLFNQPGEMTTALEVYGQLAPAFGCFDGEGTRLISGEFWNILHSAKLREDGYFSPPHLLHGGDGAILTLDHCIHLPCVVDWNGDGQADILVGAEDGYVSYLRNCGKDTKGCPIFEKIGRLETSKPRYLHAGVLPSPAAHDFNGNGACDLVVGNSAGELLFYAAICEEGEIRFRREVALKAEGVPIRIAAGLTGSIQGPSEKMFGYSCPTLANWCGSGRMDLLVSDVYGLHRLFRNLGEKDGIPQFASEQLLQFEGEPLKTVWRVRPCVVDWRGEGDLHYLALDDEGFLSDWARASDTTLTNKRLICWQDGTVMRFTVDVGGGRGRIKLCVCDWEGQGRKDLIFGTHARACVPPDPQKGQPRNSTGQAGIFFCKNVGTPEMPCFAPPCPLSYRGEPIAMGMHVASPEAVDWVGRGQLDLIVGIEDGSIVWLKREDLTW